MIDGLTWNEKYRIGISNIDFQHQHLFQIVGRITALDAVTSTKEELRSILLELSNYMKEHFHDEEEYMLKIKFPEYEYHRVLHHDIIDFVNKSITNSPSITMIKTKLKFIIKKALIDHILEEDMKIKLFVVSQMSEENVDEVLHILA
jgi:hemerythrin